MNKMKPDGKLIGSIMLEITDRIKLINRIFPKENEKLLKHLAAGSIHLAFFVRDVYDYLENEKTSSDENSENRFLEECGCDFNKK